MAEPSAIPIIILSFNRPAYLESVLTSLAAQRDADLPRRQIFLLQDGGHNRFSGRTYSSDAVTLANLDLFRRLIPTGIPLLSAHNLGIALNFDRAERLAFEELGAEAAIFLEDDLELGPWYLKTLDRLIALALADERIGYVAAYGEHRAPQAEQRANASRLIMMGQNWAFGLTRRQWLKQRLYVEQYLDIVRNQDYRARDHDRIIDLFHSWGLGVPGTSQDIAKSHACILTGTAKVRTYAAFGRYIGAQGTNFTTENFERMGFNGAEMLEEDAFQLVPPSDDQLREFVIVARRSAMHEAVQRKAPLPDAPAPPLPSLAGPALVVLQPAAPAKPKAAAAPPPPPAPPPPRDMPPSATAADAQVRIRELISQNEFAAADALAREWLVRAPEFRDQFGHLAFLKELTRIALARGQLTVAQEFAARLAVHLAPSDPCVQVLFARAHERNGDIAAAAAEWQAVLAKQPDNREAQRSLQAVREASGATG